MPKPSIALASLAIASLAFAAPTHANPTPDYSAFLNAVAASGNTPTTNEKLIAAGDIICDGLRSGESPLDVEQDVKQAISGLSEVQTVLMVHAAQDDLCPDTE